MLIGNKCDKTRARKITQSSGAAVSYRIEGLVCLLRVRRFILCSSSLQQNMVIGSWKQALNLEKELKKPLWFYQRISRPEWSRKLKRYAKLSMV